MLHISANGGVLAAAGGAHFLDAGNLLAETHAASAMDATRHFSRHQRTQIRVPDHPFLFRVTGAIAAITHGQILQFAFTALVADRAIQRMVDEQKFHGAFLCIHGQFGTGKDFHAIRHRGGAGRQRLGRFFHLHQAHAAIGGDGQMLVIAETRNIDARAIGHLDEHFALFRLQLSAIYFDIEHECLIILFPFPAQAASASLFRI